MTSPDPSINEPAGNRSSWNDDGPKVPDFRPGGFRAQAQYLKMIVALSFISGAVLRPAERKGHPAGG